MITPDERNTRTTIHTFRIGVLEEECVVLADELRPDRETITDDEKT